MRVLKTTRQTSETTIGYREAARRVIEQDGWRGLFGRGLGTRLATNALQASIFTIVWSAPPARFQPSSPTGCLMRATQISGYPTPRCPIRLLSAELAEEQINAAGVFG